MDGSRPLNDQNPNSNRHNNGQITDLANQNSTTKHAAQRASLTNLTNSNLQGLNGTHQSLNDPNLNLINVNGLTLDQLQDLQNKENLNLQLLQSQQIATSDHCDVNGINLNQLNNPENQMQMSSTGIYKKDTSKGYNRDKYRSWYANNKQRDGDSNNLSGQPIHILETANQTLTENESKVLQQREEQNRLAQIQNSQIYLENLRLQNKQLQLQQNQLNVHLQSSTELQLQQQTDNHILEIDTSKLPVLDSIHQLEQLANRNNVVAQADDMEVDEDITCIDTEGMDFYFNPEMVNNYLNATNNNISGNQSSSANKIEMETSPENHNKDLNQVSVSTISSLFDASKTLTIRNMDDLHTSIYLSFNNIFIDLHSDSLEHNSYLKNLFKPLKYPVNVKSQRRDKECLPLKRNFGIDLYCHEMLENLCDWPEHLLQDQQKQFAKNQRQPLKSHEDDEEYIKVVSSSTQINNGNGTEFPKINVNRQTTYSNQLQQDYIHNKNNPDYQDPHSISESSSRGSSNESVDYNSMNNQMISKYNEKIFNRSLDHEALENKAAGNTMDNNYNDNIFGQYGKNKYISPYKYKYGNSFMSDRIIQLKKEMPKATTWRLQFAVKDILISKIISLLPRSEKFYKLLKMETNDSKSENGMHLGAILAAGVLQGGFQKKIKD